MFSLPEDVLVERLIADSDVAVAVLIRKESLPADADVASANGVASESLRTETGDIGTGRLSERSALKPMAVLSGYQWSNAKAHHRPGRCCCWLSNLAGKSLSLAAKVQSRRAQTRREVLGVAF